MWTTEGIVGFTLEPAMSTDMMAKKVMMQVRMSRKKHRKLMMHQHRMGRTEGIILESVNIRQYLSDLENPIMAKQMQLHGTHLKQRLY
jgi:hypothetical protein